MPNGNINGDLASHGHISGVLTIGSGGTSDYELLENKPQINGHELIDNQTAHELGLASMQDVSDIESDIALLSQKLPKNYSTAEQNTNIKWIDGKNIYQKTIILSNQQTWNWNTPNILNQYIDINVDRFINVIAYENTYNSSAIVTIYRNNTQYEGYAFQNTLVDSFTMFYTKNE